LDHRKGGRTHFGRRIRKLGGEVFPSVRYLELSMHSPRLRMSVASLRIVTLLIAVSLGSYFAGYRGGFAEGCRRPPNHAQDRALEFARSQCVRSDRELCAIYQAAKGIEAGDPGFLLLKPRVSASPSNGDASTAVRWTVTFTDPKSKRSV